MGKRIIVISGINLIDGGPVSVFHDFLESIVENGYHEINRVIALVGKRELFLKFDGKIELIELRKSKKNWFRRLYYEYFYFKKLSGKWNVDTWVSMHDITPNVIANHRYVYCHNPSPFNHMSIKDAKYGWKYYLFSKFYKYLYKINIKKNDAVIVQQDWMRKEFINIYGVRKVIVARPSLSDIEVIENDADNGHTKFIFPSFPRYYKNFQVACEAAKYLYENGTDNFCLYITLGGNENRYAMELRAKYEGIKVINFCGLLDRNKLFQLYASSNCLVFMSKLETWGMPVTEYKSTGKSLIVSDLPYAHETVGNYDKVAFVDPDDSVALADIMKYVIQNGEVFGRADISRIEEPYAENWNELCSLLFK